MVKKAWKLTLPLVVLSLGGAYISLLLLDQHLLKAHGPTWFARVCGDEAATDQATGTTQPTSQPAGEPPEPSHPEPAVGKTAQGGRNCAAVLASRWATIPPRPRTDEGVPTTAGPQMPRVSIPSAYLGFVYFGTLAIWFLFVGRPTPDRTEYYYLPLVFIICGVLGSLFFIYIMFTQTKEWCPWCLTSHVINFLILIGMLLLRPGKAPDAQRAAGFTPPGVARSSTAAAGVARSSTAAAGGEAGPCRGAAGFEADPLDTGGHIPPGTGLCSGARSFEHGPGSIFPDASGTVPPAGTAVVPPPIRSHPADRLVVVCVLLAAAVGATGWQSYQFLVAEEEKKFIQRDLDGFRKDKGFLAALYDKEPMVKIPLRPDDPQIARGDVQCSMVVFSDFECPVCGRFPRLLERSLQPLFGGRLRVTWKHYPLCTDCNSFVKYNTHPQACRAALAAEAARMQGGNEAFWKAHDRLFAAAAQRRLAELDYRALAAELGLDPDRFVADMDSPAAAARITEDTTLAKSLGVNSTPAVFLSGRRVDSKLLGVLPFWEEMADRFLRFREVKLRERDAKAASQPGGATTPPATAPTTPDSPDHADAP